jgi:hypothetical protein
MKFILIVLGLLLAGSLCAQETITTNSPLQTSFCAGGNIIVEYTTTGTFNLNCTFTAQLSDAWGDFTNPVDVGSMPFNTGVIVGTIPSSTEFGFGYRVRVVSDNPVVIGSVSPLPSLFITSSAVSADIWPDPEDAICQGDTVSLWVAPNEEYFWSNGANTQSIDVTESGTYTVTVTNYFTGCQVTSAPYTVVVHPLPELNLGNDTAVCQGQILNLNAGSGMQEYQWSTGSIQQTIVVDDPGVYAVTITDANNCENTDSISLVVNANPYVNLGNDTVFCGASVSLNAGSGFAYYNWNNGLSYNPILVVTSSGAYSVLVTDANACTDSDTININVFPNPVLNLGNDLALCGTSIMLNGGAGYASYNWNNGAGFNQHFFVTSTSDNILMVTNGYGCMAIDTIHVDVFSLPDVELGPDQTIFLNGDLWLSAGAGYDQYFWSTGESTEWAHIVGSVIGPGNHTVSVWVVDSNGCANSDQIIINVSDLTGIEAFASGSVALWPLPFKEELHIEIPGDISNATISISDITGRNISLPVKKVAGGFLIERGDLAPGIFLISIRNSEELKATYRVIAE